MTGPELRTIFLGMDQSRDELLFSNVKGKNPFKDIRVREAFYKAIDIELIKNRVMRGLSTPSALMIAPQLFALSKEFTRPKFDPDGAKKLLTEAGYPTASKSRWTAPTTVTSTTPRSARPWSACSPASESRSTCWRNRSSNISPRC